MNRFASALVTTLFAPLLLAAPVPKGLKRVRDEDRIVGVWVEADNPKAVWFFNADGTCGTGEPTAPALKAVYRMDGTPSPPHLDWSQDGGKSWYLDVYQLDGDTLKMSCGSGGSGVRPATVDPKNGTQWLHLIRREVSR
jgi:uncharacterized protein (TIGR03067 family)